MPECFPHDIYSLLESMLYFGEFTNSEKGKVKSMATTCLKQAGILQKVESKWLATINFYNQLPVDNVKELTKKLCFIHPAYRRYLIVLIAGEITRHGLEGAMNLTENWVVKEFFGIARELNLVLDELERDYLGMPVKQATPGNIVRSCNNQMDKIQRNAGFDFNTWNKELFSVSGNNEAVFQVLLSRHIFHQERSVINNDIKEPPSKIVDLNTDLTNPSGRLVFFPPFEFQEFENGELSIKPYPIWRKRHYVYSSIPLWDYNDDNLITNENLQNAFCHHPIPWILIQLGIVQYTQSVMGESDKPILMSAMRDSEGSITDIEISAGQDKVVLFSTILPGLLDNLGFHLVLPFGSIEDRYLSGLLLTLCMAHIFDLDNNNQFILEDGFVNRLNERENRKDLVKIPMPFRNLLVKRIKSLL